VEKDADHIPPGVGSVVDPGEAAPDPPSTPRTQRKRREKEQQPKPRRRFPGAAIARAFRSGRPVEGQITGLVKGGYEVRVGKSRAFCPHSQMDLRRVERPEELVGRSFEFRVTQFRGGGEDVVVSRRAILEAERIEDAKAVRATLREGQLVCGKVVGATSFGAFVDLGAGVTGLVHVSELAGSRAAGAEQAVRVGESIRVRILKIDEAGRRISLSARQVAGDPWDKVEAEIKAGQVLTGTVLRLAEFGAFVELRPGVEALAPAREFPPRRDGWRAGLEIGTTADWLVLSVDANRRRISVAPAPEGGAAGAALRLEPGRSLKGRTQRVERFGVFVWLAPGMVGLMPRVWSGVPAEADLARRFPVGDEVEVEVVEVGERGNRIGLARKGCAPRKAARKAPPEPPVPTREAPQEGPPPAFGNTMAEKLRAALGRSED
jgi:small subunit ribosomal protein S1